MFAPQILVRTFLGAALAAALSGAALVPAGAATLPAITWQGAIAEGASFVYGQVPAAPTCVALEDATPVTCTVTGYDTGVGVHQLLATAASVDDPSLVTTATINYTVTAWTLKGFFKPVKKDAVTKVKGGATVPLKFKVFQGDTKAKSTSVVASLTAQQYDCATLALIGDATAITGTRAGFRLKFRDGRFHQNWKAPKLPKATKVKGKQVAPAPVCYVITLTTQDSSTLAARFQLH